MPHLENIEAVLAHCYTVNNDYQQDSRVLHIFVHNKLLDQLLDFLPKNFLFSKTLIYWSMVSWSKL